MYPIVQLVQFMLKAERENEPQYRPYPAAVDSSRFELPVRTAGRDNDCQPKA